MDVGHLPSRRPEKELASLFSVCHDLVLFFIVWFISNILQRRNREPAEITSREILVTDKKKKKECGGHVVERKSGIGFLQCSMCMSLCVPLFLFTSKTFT